MESFIVYFGHKVVPRSESEVDVLYGYRISVFYGSKHVKNYQELSKLRSCDIITPLLSKTQQKPAIANSWVQVDNWILSIT